jgi:hypothetical protein
MRRVQKAGLALALSILAGTLLPGCATMTGLMTGAFTGAVDAPAQVYRYNRGEFHRNPIYWPFNLILFVPLGLAAGPIVGMAKGIALDVEWCMGRTPYDPVFGSYRDPSIWRPYTIHW